ncbi:MAG: NADH-quinone oxidoreductase subunit M [Dehalococcoidia bacterium]|nr:NADH-quinone oxidoreductase subunit M [Dehalococcoidia bacterium]
MMHILSIIIFLPLAASIALVLLPRLPAKAIKYSATVIALAVLALSLHLFANFDRSFSGMQFEEIHSWIPALSANYHLGVDGISLPLVVLTALLGLVSVLISWKIKTRIREFIIWLLVLESSILGVFCSLNLLLFFIFWEIEVIPVFFLISIWGSGSKRNSAMKYVLFTLAGSALMLAGIVCTYYVTGSLEMYVLEYGRNVLLPGLPPVSVSYLPGMAPAMSTIPIFFMFLAGFAVKLPVVPLHIWQPDTYSDAPIAVNILLSGALAKMGAYGIIRICVSLFPQSSQRYAPIMLTLAVIGILYGGILALRQTHLKRLIAYSSMSHMGFVLLGIFALGQTSMVGASLQMVSHGLITALLFITAGIVIEKTDKPAIASMGGLARQMPATATFFVLAGLGALGLPATSGFAAEFTTLLGSFGSTVVDSAQWFTAVALLGVLLSAVYILWTIQRVFYGPALSGFDNVRDAGKLERFYCGLLVIIIFVIGICPTILTSVIQNSVAGIVPWMGG